MYLYIFTLYLTVSHKCIAAATAMNARIICFLFLLLFLIDCPFKKLQAQSYGLSFSSHETILEQRTSLDLTESGLVCFSQQMEFSFDFAFNPNFATYFGYIFRIINDKNENIDLLYDQQKQHFLLVNKETFTDINFTIDSNALFTDWTRLSFTISADGQIICKVNNKTLRTKGQPLNGKCYKIIMGANNEHNFVSRDLPPMRIRNIDISLDGKLSHRWPLDESEGVIATDKIGQKKAKASNPVWLRPLYNNWQTIRQFVIKGAPSTAFDARQEILYIVAADTLYSFSAKTNTFRATPLSRPHAPLASGNQSVFNNRTGQLLNFFRDQQELTTYDFSRNAWNEEFSKPGLTEFWQHNKFFSSDNTLYVFGGYGQMKYKNTFQRVNAETHRWDTVKPAGDFIAPRYLSALGTSSTGDTAYIMGGFGSNEGDQLLSPRHYYDLFRYDVRTNSIKKIYTLNEPSEQFVFGSSLVMLPDRKNFYALVFPNDRFNSQLQLIQGSIDTPAYQLLGNTFPYSFKDTRSFADLFYAVKSQQLLSVTLFTTKENNTEVKIFSINSPPNVVEAKANNIVSAGRGNNYIIFIGGAIVLLGIVSWGILRRKKAKTNAAAPAITPAPSNAVATPGEIPASAQPVNTSAATSTPAMHEGVTAGIGETIDEAVFSETPRCRVQLFGNFDVLTPEGVNITKQFTPLLKELFLLILIDSLCYNKGVSAEKLNEILWHNKDVKDAKNNRSVNMVKLKNIFEKMGGFAISRETGAWKMEVDPALVNMDFLEYLQLLHASGMSVQAKAGRLMKLLKPGSFLQEVHWEWLDKVKADISNFVIETLLKYSEQLTISTDAEKLITVCDSIFSFDELNEHALKLKCRSLVALGRHTLAKNTFSKFVTKYKEIYGEEFETPYAMLVLE